VVEIEEVDENCSKLQNCGGGFGPVWGILVNSSSISSGGLYVCRLFSEISFGGFLHSIFGVHFCPFFGQFSIADLLVLRDFFDVEGGFWAFFRRVFDRTFHRVFTLVRVAPLWVIAARWLPIRWLPPWLVDRSSTSIGAVNCSTQLTLLVFYVACFSVCDKLHFADFHSGFSARSSVDS
jgi:hypothetical protein